MKKLCRIVVLSLLFFCASLQADVFESTLVDLLGEDAGLSQSAAERLPRLSLPGGRVESDLVLPRVLSGLADPRDHVRRALAELLCRTTIAHPHLMEQLRKRASGDEPVMDIRASALRAYAKKLIEPARWSLVVESLAEPGTFDAALTVLSHQLNASKVGMDEGMQLVDQLPKLPPQNRQALIAFLIKRTNECRRLRPLLERAAELVNSDEQQQLLIAMQSIAPVTRAKPAVAKPKPPRERKKCSFNVYKFGKDRSE
jgi:hypothetical protein